MPSRKGTVCATQMSLWQVRQIVGQRGLVCLQCRQQFATMSNICVSLWLWLCCVVTGQTDSRPERTCMLTVQTAVCQHIQHLCDCVVLWQVRQIADQRGLACLQCRQQFASMSNICVIVLWQVRQIAGQRGLACLQCRQQFATMSNICVTVIVLSCDRSDRLWMREDSRAYSASSSSPVCPTCVVMPSAILAGVATNVVCVASAPTTSEL